MKRIAIDISAVVYGTGVSKYISNLVDQIIKSDKQNKYLLFGYSLRRKKELADFCINYPQAECKLYRFPPYLADLIWNKIHIINVERLIGEIDIFHSSDWVQPPTKAKKVTTVHDLVPVLYPEYSHPKIVSVHNKRFNWVVKEVDIIIVPSESTKKDLMKLGVKSKKVVVIPEAVVEEIVKVKESYTKLIKTKYNLQGDFIISVGIGRRKNTSAIIKAYKKIKDELNLSHLVLVGENKLGLKGDEGLIFTGFVNNKQLSALYKLAKALVYPSFYEGFGLPILEAYKVGTPVVTSNLGSMKETAGSGAVLVDPKSVDSIAQGIVKAIKNAKELSLKGRKQLIKYSWKDAADETIKVYNSLFD